MPHILLEYPAHILNPSVARTIFADLHEAILPMESINVADLKSRAMPYHEVYIGDGDRRRTFVHLQLKLLTGRDQSVRQRLAKECMRVLQSHFTAAVMGDLGQISVEVCEMERSTYVKQASSSIDNTDADM